MKRRWTKYLLILILLIGLSLLLYPSFSNYWNSTRQSKAMNAYLEDVSGLAAEEMAALWQQAEDYNTALTRRTNGYALSDEQRLAYETLLNPDGSGTMGIIEIPAIDVMLPIYHGCTEQVLQVAVGHMEWSSLPVGGAGSHCVLSGHRGLPSAKLFSDLDRIVAGDVFLLHVLDRTLTYEVDQILTVKPEDVSALAAVPGRDLCTLVTCTPYGINTHRMLVRGHRIETAAANGEARVISEAMRIEPLVVAPMLAAPLLVLLFLLAILTAGGRGRSRPRSPYPYEHRSMSK